MHGTRDSKWSKSGRERQIPYDITYIWNLIYGTNGPFHRKETPGFLEQTCGCKGEGREWSGLGVRLIKIIAFGVDKQWDPAV